MKGMDFIHTEVHTYIELKLYKTHTEREREEASEREINGNKQFHMTQYNAQSMNVPYEMECCAI